MFIEDKNDINAAPSVIFSLYMTQINLWHEGGISVTSHQHPLQSVSLQTPDTELISTQASPLSRYLQRLELHVQEGGAGDQRPGCPPRPRSWRGADRPTQRRLHSISGSVSGDGVGSPRTRPGFAKRIKKLNELRVNSISGGFTAFQCLQTSNQVWMVILDSCVSSDTF